MTETFSWSFFFGGAVGIVVGWWISKRVIRPAMRRMDRAVQRVFFKSPKH